AARHDGPASTHRKHPIDREARARGRPLPPRAAGHAIPKLDERGPDVVDSVTAGPGRDDHEGTAQGRSVEQLPNLPCDLVGPGAPDGIGFRDDRDSIGDSERVEEAEMLDRL